MIEAKKSGLSIVVESSKLVGDVAVGICFPLECDNCALSKLQGGSNCNSQCFPVHTEEAALGYSLYLAVRQQLCGDPLAVSKTKVGDVSCVSHNGMFGINWNVKGTGSAVRKSIGLALKVLDPVKHASTYTRCIKQLNGSFSREVFNYVADKARASIDANTQIAVIGNIKTDDGKLNDILSVVIKKHETTKVDGTKTKPSAHTTCDHSTFTEVKVAGWGAVVASDFIQFKVKGLVPLVMDNSLLLPIKPAQWDTLKPKLKSAVRDYVNAKYTKVSSDNLPGVFGYLALSSGRLCATDVKTSISSKLSTDKIVAVLNGLF